jgi:hypothetical protein
MAQTMDVRIPHRLGKAEAKQRLALGLAKIDPAALGLQQVRLTNQWDGDTLDLELGAFGQVARAVATVDEEEVRLSITLPWLLARIAETLRPKVKQQVQKLLAAPRQTL